MFSEFTDQVLDSQLTRRGGTLAAIMCSTVQEWVLKKLPLLVHSKQFLLQRKLKSQPVTSIMHTNI